VANLNATEILSREKLKMLLGGGLGDTGTCGAYLPGNAPINKGSYSGDLNIVGSATAPAYNAGSGHATWKNISKETALAMTNGISGAKWCCDSCNDASWY
jgi:hypothetical protein